VIVVEGAFALGLMALFASQAIDEGGPVTFHSVFELIRLRMIAFARENPYVVFLAVWGALRAMGTTVRTGYTGLFFSFGHARRVLQPGFVFKIPYFQKVRSLPTRSRTLDVPDQKVTSVDGLVWFVDVNLVYRIVDIRKALIEIDDLEHGMEQMLSLSVQEIVGRSRRAALRLAGELDGQLAESMEVRLEAWGVAVERAGFTSIKPSPKTLRFTQQLHTCEERERNLERLVSAGIDRGLALAMLGSAPRLRRRELYAVEREQLSRRRRRILRSVEEALKASSQEVGASFKAELRASFVRELA